jgi:glycosyltransferase involved in cell wall biosynthesis
MGADRHAVGGQVGVMAAAVDGETLVDVGVPTYGEPAFLAETIASVVGQTFTAWQLTISENGPGSDHVRAIVERFLADPRVRLVATGHNIGGARNATRAITAGSARYVALLHDDDRWEPGFLERRVSFLEAHPSCGLVFSDCDFIDGDGAVLYRIAAELPPGLQPRTAFFRSLYRRNFIGIPTVLARRSAYDRVGAAYNDKVLFYDYDMWLRIAASYDVGFLDGCDAGYRVHASQTTNRERLHMGEHRLQLLEAVDAYAPAGFSRLERRRARSGAFLQSTLDALRSGERLAAVAQLGRALLEYPAAPVDPRMAVLVAGSRRRGARQRQAWGD